MYLLPESGRPFTVGTKTSYACTVHVHGVNSLHVNKYVCMYICHIYEGKNGPKIKITHPFF